MENEENKVLFGFVFEKLSLIMYALSQVKDINFQTKEKLYSEANCTLDLVKRYCLNEEVENNEI